MTTTSTRLTGKGLVEVIRACKEAHVARLKVGDIEVNFNVVYNAESTEHSDEDNSDIVPPVTDVLKSDKKSDEESEKRLMAEIDREIEEANLIIEDPTKWEQQATSQIAEEVG